MIAASTGFFSGLALIVAIGAQNAFVLRQGLLREHVFGIVLFCAVSDALLIGAGILGLGAAIESVPWLLVALRFVGAAYLIWFGIGAVRRAINPGSLEGAGSGRAGIWGALATAAGLTFLNPHVYIDTVILLGSIGNQFQADRWLFWIGASLGSFVWFFGLGYFARLLAPLATNPRFWRILESVIAIVIFTIAGYLLFGL